MLKGAYVQACRDALFEVNYFFKLMNIMDNGFFKHDQIYEGVSQDVINMLRPLYIRWIIPAGPSYYINIFQAENRFIKADSRAKQQQIMILSSSVKKIKKCRTLDLAQAITVMSEAQTLS